MNNNLMIVAAVTLALAAAPAGAQAPPGASAIAPGASAEPVKEDGRRAISPELDARIAAEDYSAEERANIEATIRFRSLERPFKMEEISRIVAKDYKATRHGMDTLIAVTGDTDGYNFQSMNDRRDTIVDIVAKGDRVWVYFRMDGHHTGPWFGQKATGKPTSVHELGILRFRDGLIVEAFFMVEELELARQLGIVPTARPPEAKH